MTTRILLLVLLVLAPGLPACNGSGFLKSVLYQGSKSSGPRLPNGQQNGEWTYWYDVERDHVQAQGKFEEDQHVGTWTWWHLNGNKMQEVRLEDDVFEGPASTYWENGNVRARGTNHGGLKEGDWTFWRDDGSRECAGGFARGARHGAWTWWNADGSALGRADFVHGERREVVASAPPVIVPATVAVAAAPPAAPTPTPVVVIPASEALALPRNRPCPPTGAQALPFSTLQSGEAAADKQVTQAASPGIDTLVLVYDHLRKASTRQVRDEYGHGDERNPASEPERDDERSDPLLGKVLDWTRVTREDGSVLDLASYRGKSKVLLVVMRGMKGPICEYCCGQAEVLKHRVPDFRKVGAEVVIVYPGDEEALKLFHERVQEYYLKHYGADDHPECLLACDIGLRLVDALGVRRDLALPTAIILDTRGVVRFSYVGRDKQDRLCADQLLEKVASIR